MALKMLPGAVQKGGLVRAAGAKTAGAVATGAKKSSSRLRGLIKQPKRSIQRYFGLGRYRLTPKVSELRRGQAFAPRVQRRRKMAVGSMKRQAKAGKLPFIAEPSSRYKRVLALEKRLAKAHRRRRLTAGGVVAGGIVAQGQYRKRQRKVQRRR